MAMFEQTVAVPGTRDYAPPTPDIFAQVAGLPGAYYQGQFNRQQRELNDQRIQQGQRQDQLAKAFPNGLPIDPSTGTTDYRAVASTLARFGDVGSAVNVMEQQPAPLSPMFGGGQPAAAPAPQAAQPAPTVSPSTAQTAAKIIQVESGGNPNASNPNSSAEGLGQFTSATWLDAIKKYYPNLAQGRSDDQLLAMRKIPQLAMRVTEAFTADHEAALSRAGLPVTPATTYLAHFAGLGGAIKVLRADPDTPVSQILGKDAVKANPFLKDMTARDLESWAARKMAGPAMMAQNATSAQANAAGPRSGAPTSFAGRFAGDQPAGSAANIEVADASGNLPPSANAGTPAARRAPQGGAQGAPNGAGAPAQDAPQQTAQIAPQQPQQQAAQPQQQVPPQQPLVPQVPLPKGYADPQQAILALRAEAARLSGNPRAAGQVAELNNWAGRIEESIKPVQANPNTTMLDPRSGQVLYEGPAAASLRAVTGAEGSPSLDADAERYRQTGQLPPNMGRGLQGAAEARAIRQRATQLEQESGGDPATWPGRWQDFKASGIGKNTAERTKASREENLNLILRAADAAIPAALEASKALPRTAYVPLNKLIQKGEIMSSDPRLVEFGMANLQLAEHWARAMNPTGVMRESDRDKALSFLDTAYSNNTYERAVMQLQKQITRERDAVRGGGTILKDNKAPAPGDDGGSGAVSKDGWTVVTAPNGKKARIQEITE